MGIRKGISNSGEKAVFEAKANLSLPLVTSSKS
jgi:hypothetical protein